jgi:hypothetical protein
MFTLAFHSIKQATLPGANLAVLFKYGALGFTGKNDVTDAFLSEKRMYEFVKMS